MNKDITLITLEYPPDRGGVGSYLAGLVRASNGAIRVIVPEGHETTGPGQISSATLFRQSWPLWWPMVGICRRQQTTVLISHVFPVGTAAWISRLLGGPEYAVIMHGLDIRLARGVWKRWLLRRICRNAKATIVNSDSTKTDLHAIVPGIPITVLTPAVDEAAFPSRADARSTLGLSPDESCVVSVTRLVPRKGIDFSLRAMSRVQTSRDVRYVIVGDGPDRERLEGVAADSRTKVLWITNADDETKRIWLAAADIFLLPVRDEGTDVEGFGIVFLEAAQAGVPSIAGKSGGAVEAVRHERTGLVVNPDSIGEIKESLERLLDDNALRRRLGEEGRVRVQNEFRWHDRWDKLSRVLGL